MIRLAVQSERSLGDAISITPDDRSQKSASRIVAVGVVAVHIVKAQPDLGPIAIAIGSFQRNDDATVADNLGFNGAITQGEDFDGRSIGNFAKRLSGHG